jgi:sialidase-1
MAPTFEHVLATRGVGGYRQYRIPALAVSTAGTVLAAYDGRPNLDDLPNPIDLLLRRSTDGGRSWGPQQVVRTGTGLEGFGDPSLLVDAETGRIFMFHAAGTRAGFFEAVAGLQPDGDVQHCDLSYSDDDGASWRHRRLTSQLKRGGITGIFAAAGAGIQLHTGPHRGRLLQQFVLLDGGRILAASAYSDDHGDTWTLGETIGPDTNENKTVCLADGRVLLHSRSTPHRLTAVSRDGGNSYSPVSAHPELPDPSDNGSVARFDGLPSVTGLAAPQTEDWLIATHNHDPDLRRNTMLKLSRDNGASWAHAFTVCPGSSAYSTAARLPDGRIGVLYERQGYRDMVFASVDPQDLLATGPAADPAEPVATGHGLVFDLELRSITPALPEVWQALGESVTLPGTHPGISSSVWKEMGQGYSADQVQVLSNRESQEANYGPPRPGYRAGDILAFAGRAANRGTQTLSAVELSGTFDHPEATAPTELPPGDKSLYPALAYTVTDDDVAAGRAEVTFTLRAAAQGTPIVRSRTFRFDTATGAITVTDASGQAPASSS